MGFAVIGNQRVFENLLQVVAHSFHRDRRGHFEKVTFRRATARDQQACALQCHARHHDTRTYIEAACHAVRLISDLGADPEWLAAHFNGVANFSAEAKQNSVGHRETVRLERRF